jgi:hypothetical protein
MSEFGHRRTLLSYVRFSPESEHSSARSTGHGVQERSNRGGPLGNATSISPTHAHGPSIWAN